MADKPRAGTTTLSELSQADYEKFDKLINDQYAPSESESAAAGDAAPEDGGKPIPFRQRNGIEPYLVRGAVLRCTYGSHMRKLNLPRSHGDYIGEDPTMNAKDNVPGQADVSAMKEASFFDSIGNAIGKAVSGAAGSLFGSDAGEAVSDFLGLKDEPEKLKTENTGYNIAPFGVCGSPEAPKGAGTILLRSEKINPIDGQPYTDANGNVAAIEDNVKGPPCMPIIIDLWQNPILETIIGAADETPYEAISQGSFLVCKYCGIIEPMTSGQVQLDPGKADPEAAALPPDMQEEVNAILSDGGLSSSAKADKIIGVYERYMLSLAPEAFAEYDRKRTEIMDTYPDTDDDNRKQKLTNIEQGLNETLSEQNLDIRAVLSNMGDDILRATGKANQPVFPVVRPIDLPTPLDLLTIAGLVNTNQPLDLKNRALNEMTDTDYEWSIWARQWNNPQTNARDSLVMRSDYAGNYLFGYFGAGYLDGKVFTADTLLYGAGLAQGISDMDPAGWAKNMLSGDYGDNPGDSDMIRDGINMYNNTH
jgi:hypothetical protein